MDAEQFRLHLSKVFTEIMDLTATKGEEYKAGADDQFANFNRLAADLDLPRHKVWSVLFTKHMDAIKNYVRTGLEFSEPISGRIKDAVLYLILLDAMIEEDKQRADPGSAFKAAYDVLAGRLLAEEAESNIRGGLGS